MTDFWDELPVSNFANEAEVEFRLIEPLLRALGFESEDIAPKFRVIFQEGRGGRPHEADFVCFSGPLRNKDTSLLVVEAKRPGESLSDAKTQGESYAANLRAPLLALTNGETFEIWQTQLTSESICLLNEPVSGLLQHRSTIERTLSKAAIIAYCRSLASKTILEASQDFGTYETVELKRISSRLNSIDRTLKRIDAPGSNGSIAASRMLVEFPGGAVVCGPSGYGKTTLASRLLADAVEARCKRYDGPTSYTATG